MSIFGIQDRSRKVTWKFLLACAIVGGVLFAMDRWAPGAKKAVLLGLAGLVVAFIVLSVAYGLVFRRTHPASRISDLLQAGKTDEACSEAASLLEKTPDDPLVQLNSVAAYNAAGNLGRARDPGDDSEGVSPGSHDEGVLAMGREAESG